jgi:hypothetical protein
LFWNAAQTLELGLPRLSLALHAVELSLKSYLLVSGVPIEELTKPPYGHNLKSLITNSVDRGIGRFVTLPVLFEDQIDLLSEAHASRFYLYEYTGGIGGSSDLVDSIASAICVDPMPWHSEWRPGV